MKKILMNNKFKVVALVSFLIMAVVPLASAVGPTATPPGGNVDANFNSVTTGGLRANGLVYATVSGGGNTAISGNTDTGWGVQGVASTSGLGVLGTSITGTGVGGASMSGTGVTASSSSGYGLNASSSSNYGIYATSTSGGGIYGSSSSDTSNVPGVYGHGNGGYGVWGNSTSGSGGYFNTKDSNVKLATGTTAINATGDAFVSGQVRGKTVVATDTGTFAIQSKGDIRSDGQLSGKTIYSAGALSAWGHIDAHEGIGHIYTWTGPSDSLDPWQVKNFYIECPFPDKERVLSFSFQTSGYETYMEDTYFQTTDERGDIIDINYGGSFYLKNNSSQKVTVNPQITCFDPGSYTPW